MTQERTKRFERLLRMQRQIERLAQWRMSAATAERLEAERAQAAAREAAIQSLNDRDRVFAGECQPALLHSALVVELQAEHQEREAEVRVIERAKAEAQLRDALLIVQRKARQWDKLTESARAADSETLQAAQQQEWDEFGLRKGTRDSVRNLNADESAGGAFETGALEVRS